MKKFLYKLREKAGFFFYTRKKNYQFIYEIEVKNKSNKTKSGSLVIPIPSERNDQTLVGEITFLPTKPVIKEDKLFRNHYGIWQFELQPNEKKVFQESFKIKVKPVQVPSSLLKKISLKDYEQVPKKIRDTFCSSNKYISAYHPKFIQFARQIKGSDENLYKIVNRLNRFTIEYLDYKNPILGLYSSLEGLEKKEVDCGGFDTFFAALCIALRIPARVVSGFLSGYKKSSMHAWVEFMLPNGEWVPADPSTEQLFERGKTTNTSRLGFKGSDRIIFSIGCHIPLSIGGHEISTDILQNAFITPEDKDLEVQIKTKAL
jgi:transglutaminase-like putative cysteine protease